MDNVIVMNAREMTRSDAMKEFFGTAAKPVESKELIQFMKQDKAGFIELSDAALSALGATHKATA